MPVAPFTSNTPHPVVGAELVVTAALAQGAREHKHQKDLSQARPDVAKTHLDSSDGDEIPRPA